MCVRERDRREIGREGRRIGGEENMERKRKREREVEGERWGKYLVSQEINT